MKEALYYEKGPDKKVSCTLCPHMCNIYDNETGFCKVRKNIDGVLYSLNYGKVTSLAVDPVEKKPLYHFMSGTETLSLGTFGCNMSCRWCQNYEISMEERKSEYIEPEKIVRLAKENNLPSIALTYNEPTVFFEYCLDIARSAKEADLKVIIVTNGFINEKPLLEILEYVDALNIDLKTFRDKTYKKFSNGNLDDVLNTILLASSKAHLEITTLVVTNLNDNMKELTDLFKYISKIDKNIPLHLLRYFPRYKYMEKETDIEFLKTAYEEARIYLSNVYLGNV